MEKSLKGKTALVTGASRGDMPTDNTTHAIGSSAIRSEQNGEDAMSTEKKVQTVKNFFAAIGRGDKEGLLALVAEDVEWIIPGEDWPLAGAHGGHAELAAVLQKASEEVEMTYPTPPQIRGAGRSGPSDRLRHREDQSHE
jgi:SnoaL-like domain